MIVEQPKVVLAICDRCHKPIYKPEDLKRHEERTQVLKGRITETQVKTVTLCGSCEIKRLEEEKIKEEKAIRRKKYELKKIRIHSFVWPGLLALALIIFGIVNLTSGNNQVGFSLIIISIFAFTFLATIILDNTFVSDVWITVRDWGFVTMPGIIFELSFDGLVFLIVVKILFFIIGMIISIAAFILATVLAAALSIIGYPLGLYRNIKGIEV